MSSAPYISLEVTAIFSSIGRVTSYKNLNSERFSQIATTASARARAPAPPFAQWLLTTAPLAPPTSASFRTSASSAGVSELAMTYYEDFINDVCFVDLPELVYGHDHIKSKLASILNVLNKILTSFFQRHQVLLAISCMQRLPWC